jgi:hypothetical protein
VITIPVDVRPETLCTGETDWSVPWHAPQDAAAACKVAGLTAEAGNGQAYVITGTQEKEIIKAIVGDVARRLKFLS